MLQVPPDRRRGARIPVVVPGLGRRGDRPPRGGHQGGAGSRGPQQGRVGLCTVGPVRASAAAEGVSQTTVCDRRARAPSGTRARPDETEPPAVFFRCASAPSCHAVTRSWPYGPATATRMPTPALSGSGVSPSIRPLLLLPATRQPVVCRTGFPPAERIQASVAMPRRVSNGGCAFHVRPWTRLVVAARFWRMSSTLGCQSRR